MGVFQTPAPARTPPLTHSAISQQLFLNVIRSKHQRRRSKLPASGISTQSKSKIQIPQKILHHLAHSSLPSNRQSPNIKSPQQNRIRPKCNRLESIRSPANSAIKQHRHAPANFSHHLRQRIQRRNRSIHLPPAMNRNNNSIHAGRQRLRGIRGVKNSLQQNRQASPPPQKRKIAPSKRRIRKCAPP